MRSIKSHKTAIAWISALLMFFSQAMPLQAAMLNNQALVGEITRADLIEALDNTELQTLLVSRGVDIEAAQLRIRNMNDDELLQLKQEFEQLPTGAGALGAAVTIFIVLVITDMLGATDIFPFVKQIK